MIYIYLVGTAGSGKSTLASSFHEWCKRNGYDTIVANLDPGVKKLPYVPEIDVREWISLDEVMKDYNLGPNGAQVVCADMLALNVVELEERLGEYSTDYVIMDTPGQLELFVFRSAGKVIIDALGKEKSMVAFLIDPALATLPSHFVSQMMLSATTQFRLDVPMVNVLTKVDIVEEEMLKKMVQWGKDANELREALMQTSSLYSQMSEGIMEIINEMEATTSFIPLSSETWEGMEDLYAEVQHVFHGGEDLERR
ncbi:MAG: ATP/GTP-binding protein [Thermoplasmata archaeon]|nr:ATP/GTP-binding protein [Thermoplasmata archaeon]